MKMVKEINEKELIPELTEVQLKICNLCKNFMDYHRFYCCQWGRAPFDDGHCDLKKPGAPKIKAGVISILF